jgi:tetratricopeptide (TPR) repeat protein
MGCSVLLALMLAASPDPVELIPLFRQALAEREKRFGPQHPKVARSASDLALYLKRLGDRDEAASLLRRVLQIDQMSFKEGHLVLAEDLENLAGVVGTAEAMGLHSRAAQCSDPGIAARNLGKLGALQEAQGDRETAAKSYRLALTKEEAGSGSEHPRVAVRLNDLALLLEPKAAEPLMIRALAIQRKALGAQHPETGVTLNNLANLLLATGRLEQAERMQREALGVLETTLGPEHPRVAVSCSNLADILRARKDLPGAKQLYRRALAIDEKAYGPSHPEVAADLVNLANLLEEMGNFEDARRLRERAEKIRKAVTSDK